MIPQPIRTVDDTFAEQMKQSAESLQRSMIYRIWNTGHYYNGMVETGTLRPSRKPHTEPIRNETCTYYTEKKVIHRQFAPEFPSQDNQPAWSCRFCGNDNRDDQLSCGAGEWDGCGAPRSMAEVRESVDLPDDEDLAQGFFDDDMFSAGPIHQRPEPKSSIVIVPCALSQFDELSNAFDRCRMALYDGLGIPAMVDFLAMAIAWASGLFKRGKLNA